VLNLNPPQENIEIFTILYKIETALRELIIEALSRIEGQKWYKRCLPGDILEKYREDLQFEKQIPWTQFVQHNPIYYLDFSDLRKIIERSDNWTRAFQPIFSRKEIVVSTLSEIEPIRNKIAHNRKATSTDVAITRGALDKLKAAIGFTYFDTLVNRCTLAQNISELLFKLQEEAKASLLSCCTYNSHIQLNIWNEVCNKWWFDDSYLGSKIDKIEEFFHLVVEYSCLPRLRGRGHKIENWVRKSDIETIFAESKVQFDTILNDI
jgi:hypothetical protein